jgi:hypothetical protein
MYEIIKPYLGEALTALVVGLPTGIYQTKKNNAEVSTTEIDRGKVVGLYKEALDDLPHRYEENNMYKNGSKCRKLFEKKRLLQETEYHKKTAIVQKMYDDKVKEFEQV